MSTVTSQIRRRFVGSLLWAIHKLNECICHSDGKDGWEGGVGGGRWAMELGRVLSYVDVVVYIIITPILISE